jgi:hypothetical protein
MILAWEACANIAELGGDLGAQTSADAPERHADAPFGQLGDGMRDATGELGDLATMAFQRSGESAHQLALGFRSGLTGDAMRSPERSLASTSAALRLSQYWSSARKPAMRSRRAALSGVDSDRGNAC